MKRLICKALNSMAKVFPYENQFDDFYMESISGLKGETVSFTLAFMLENTASFTGEDMHLQISTNLSGVKIRKVEYVPSRLAAPFDADDGYITSKSGLFPDLLTDINNNTIVLVPNQWQSVWLEVDIDINEMSGNHKIQISASVDGAESVLQELCIEIIDCILPEQGLIHTEWFHSDCLADYYGFKVFSDLYWQTVANYLKCAVKRGMNMVLTPVFTPPLDTAIGKERTTVQLVDVFVINGKYLFGFKKLRKWVSISQDVGIKYFEISHLYTQWGAKSAPKVMANINGEYKNIFGWDTDALSSEYSEFLCAFLPCLIQELKSLGIAAKTFFHISDEPSANDIEHYHNVRKQVSPLLEGFPVIDALSNVSYYRRGIIEKPIPANDHIEEFLAENINGLWTYYCVGQTKDVSNRFMALTSSRNRILGIQLYKFGLEGFLHWGFNYYNSALSVQRINPFLVTDSDGKFYSGDAFLVYPDENNHPLESIRIMVLGEAMQDIRALEALEIKKGRNFVLELIDEGLETPLTFKKFPRDPNYILSLRKKVNSLL